MAFNVEVTPRAVRDLNSIYDQIHADESLSAARWFLGLEAAILKLEQFPKRGKDRDGEKIGTEETFPMFFEGEDPMRKPGERFLRPYISQFLDTSLARGQQIYLSNAPIGQAGSYFGDELTYLSSRGVGPSTWQLIWQPFK